MFNKVNIASKIEELLAEREACIKAEEEAHARIITINRTVNKLRNALKDVQEILGETPSVETLQDISNNLS